MNMQTPRPHRPEGIDTVAIKSVSEESMEKIQRLKARASRGLFSMALFIAFSIGALRDFDFLPPLSPRILAILGTPPSANMISAALMLYSFSAIILILSRMMSGSGSYSGIAHVGYLAAFYTFYHFAGVLGENFWAVFAAGTTILGLESYHVWTFCAEEIRKELESPAQPGRNNGNGQGTDE